MKFSKTEQVKWSEPMPGPSSATPIIWGDHVFVSSTDAKARTLLALALDRTTGKVLWRQKVSDGFGRDDRSNYASPSPVTDGQRAIFYYGNGELAAFDFKGRALWHRNIQKDEGEFAFQWTYSTSPLLYDKRLYIQVLQRDVPVNGRGRARGPNDSYLLALNPETGKTLWKKVRPSNAKAESREAFTTPIPVGVGGRVDLLIAGGDALTGHDPATGVERWRWDEMNPTGRSNWRLVPSPLVAMNMAVLCVPQRGPVFGLKLGRSGQLSDEAVAWKSDGREVSSDVATPLFYQGRLFLLNGEKQVLSRMDPATGQVDWSGHLGSRTKIESSPIGADGRIYFQDQGGTVFVVSAGEEFKILHQVQMGDGSDRDTRSSIPVSGGNLFIRTATQLYCIGE